MPTATSLSGWSLINVGPATTTFTEPTSCISAYRTMIAEATDPALPLWNVNCPWSPPADCNPSGSIIQSLISSAENSNPGYFVVYQSPGLFCPAGQTTVGKAEKINPTSTSVSGAFNSSIAIPTDSDDAFFLPQLDVVLAALDPGETALLCCPSSYTAANGDCHSPIPTTLFTPTAGCRIEFQPDLFGTVNGTYTVGTQTITGGLLTLTGTEPVSTTTTTFASSEVTSYVGVAVEGMAILVHRASDVRIGTAMPPVTTTAGMTSAGTTAPVTTSRTSNSESNLPGNRNGNVIGVVTVLWCLFFAFGMHLVV